MVVSFLSLRLQRFVAGRTLASMGESFREKGIARTKDPLRQTTERDPNGVQPPSRRGGILSQGLDPGGLPGLGVSFSNLLLDYVPSLIHRFRSWLSG
jgi:hypothetical protein